MEKVKLVSYDLQSLDDPETIDGTRRRYTPPPIYKLRLEILLNEAGVAAFQACLRSQGIETPTEVRPVLPSGSKLLNAKPGKVLQAEFEE